MIRTLIEITAENDWDHARNLKATLDKLGYEPKESAESARWRSDLYQALDEKGINVGKLVEEFRGHREALRTAKAA